MGKDFNDLANEQGAEAVRRALSNAWRPEPEDAVQQLVEPARERQRERRREKQAGPEEEPAAAGKADGLEFDDDIALDARADDIVQDIVPRAAVGAIYGPSASGKTFASIDLAYRVARGEADWHGRKIRQAPVLLVPLEGNRRMRRRRLAIIGKIGTAGKMLATMKDHVQLNRSKAGEEGQARIIAEATVLSMKAGQPVGLIIIDTLARAMAPDDESKTQDMSAFITRLFAIATATGAAVLVIHHTGKDEDRGMRGSSTLFAAADFVLRVNTHTDGRHSVEAEKVKDGETGNLFAFRLPQVSLGTSEDGDPITSCVVECCELPDSTPKKQRGRQRGSAEQDECMRALEMALDEVGTVPHGSNHMPQGAGARVVTFDQLRVYAGNIGLIDPDGARKGEGDKLRRYLTKLAREKKADRWQQFIWKIK